jgi:hypothetical protein
VPFEKFTYPPCDAPLLDAWDHAFECVYVLLHPFIRVPDDLAWKLIRQYPTDEQILSVGAKYRWSQVAAHTRIPSCARLNQALLTATGSISFQEVFGPALLTGKAET